MEAALTDHDAVEPRAPEDSEEQPIGSLFILMIFLIVLAGTWGAVYFVYLGR